MKDDGPFAPIGLPDKSIPPDKPVYPVMTQQQFEERRKFLRKQAEEIQKKYAKTSN
jgi:hypothetical protein